MKFTETSPEPKQPENTVTSSDDMSHVVREEVWKTLYNSAVVTPVNAGANLINAISSDTVGKLTPAKVNPATFGSATWFVQTFAQGTGTALSYAAAGQIAGTLFRTTGRAASNLTYRMMAKGEAMSIALPLEKLAASKHLANVTGAMAFDGLRDVGPGETRLGNIAGGAAAMSCFTFAPLVKGNVSGIIARDNYLMGAAGGAAQEMTSSLINNGELPTWKELAKSAASAGWANTMLPSFHRGIEKIADYTGEKLGLGVPLQRYVERAGYSPTAREMPALAELIASNPLARVKTHNTADVPVMSSRNMIHIAENAPPRELIAELARIDAEKRTGDTSLPKERPVSLDEANADKTMRITLEPDNIDGAADWYPLHDHILDDGHVSKIDVVKDSNGKPQSLAISVAPENLAQVLDRGAKFGWHPHLKGESLTIHELLANSKDGYALPQSLTLDRPSPKTIETVAAKLKDLRSLDLTLDPLCSSGIPDPTRLAPIAQLKDLQHLKLSNCNNSDLAYLKELPKLESLDLGGNHISDEGLAHVTHLTNLRSLNLSRTEVTEAGIRRITGLKQLQRLNVSTTRASVPDISHFTSLHELNLAHCPRVTDAGLWQLSALKDLRKINLEATKITDEGLPELSKIDGLTHLNLTATDVTDAGLRNFTCPLSLQELNLTRTQVQGPGLETLHGHPKLHTLNLSGLRGINDGTFAAKLDLPQLRDLNLSLTSISNPTVIGLAQFPKLETLTLSRTRVNDIGGLSGLPELKDVRLDGLLLSNKRMPRMDQVHTLSLADAFISPESLAGLKDSPNLTNLVLSRVYEPGSTGVQDKRLNDEHLAYLSGLQQVQNLDLSLNGITGTGFKHLATLPNLTQINLCGNPIRETQLVQLMNISNLTHLDLSGTALSDAAPGYLRLFPKLQHLNLELNYITDWGAAQLQNKFHTTGAPGPVIHPEGHTGVSSNP